MSTINNIAGVLLLLVVNTVQADYGIGAIEDPVTREYTEEVSKDWQEGITLFPTSGDYVITYRASEGSYAQVIFEPATKIEPILKSKYKTKSGSGVISYGYKLKSKVTSKQPISSIRTTVSVEAPTLTTLPAPTGWLGSLSLVAPGAGSRLGWRYRQLDVKLGGLDPGKSIEGFEFEASDLPGVAVMRIEGASRTTTWLGEVPDIETTVGAQVNQLRLNDFVPRLAAVPKIPNPTPFNAAVVLGGMQKHVKDDMASMQLIDPNLLAAIDRGLTQAIAAAQIGNTSSLLHEIKNLRKLLKQEHKDVDQDDDDRDDDDKNKAAKRQIDKLAAQVLDFNLKYVEKRVKGEKD